ncbi:TPA: tyrosine-type recombinase/integrase [Serratia marcescens]|uniref:Integrase n=1 Tax=Serratia marcescens TaxID=615 RepID=A0A2F0PKK9_SERMA|nr:MULTISPECIES: tyrosine-type recombinase/integrase [Serratia]AUY15286.1 integrase [Serratia sp. SSNIH1]MDK4857054.1 tyrosine-type recombinase/integrase [Serratia nevei]MDK5108014.1 tyrosine-type recombinase/integrase [Serratia nevei]MDK5112968.1 tyrosine-type recombinase/integrase [Serratia nevei]MDK5703375.1 tyrosine-type recombinase/integrase [Serratia nevei]
MARNRNHARRDLPPNLYARNGGYYCYRDPRTGKEYGLGRVKRDAINQAIEANLQLMDSAVRLVDRINGKSCITFHAWLLRYDEIVASRGLKAKTLEDYRNRIKAIERGFADIEIDAITTKDIADFVNEYVKQGKNMRAKSLRASLVDIFKEAIADGHTQTNPVDATRNPKAEVQRERLTLDDYLRIRDAANSQAEWVGLSMDLALVTGQRVSDISSLKWSDIHDGRVWITQQKTNARLAIPVDLELVSAGLKLDAVLSRCKVAFGECETVLASHLRSALSPSTISMGFTKARKDSGLSWTRPPSFHELRSLSARLYSKEKEGDFAQRLLGHKTAEMTAKYQDDRGNNWVNV